MRCTDAFKRRLFTGAEVLAITDQHGIGVGATMHTVEVELKLPVHCLTRDDAVEGAGRLRVQHESGLTGIVMSYDLTKDTCTVSVDSPNTYLTAPRPSLSARPG